MKFVKPKVSVIVPIYNSELYLRECLDSLKNQTLQEIQIICIDDASTDSSGAIVDEYAKDDNRFIVVHQKNQGPVGARNVGLELAKGEYITFMDCDDYINLDTYEKTYLVAREHNVDVLNFGIKTFPSEIDWVNELHTLSMNFNSLTDLSKFPDLPPMLWNKLYNGKMIRESGVKLAKILPAEDDCFNLLLRPWVKRLESIGEVFYHYRQHPNSIMHKELKNVHLVFNIIPTVCEAWRKKGAIKGNEAYLIKVLLRPVFPHFLSLANQNKNYAKQILTSFGDDVYNKEVVSQLSGQTLEWLRIIEEFANKE